MQHVISAFVLALSSPTYTTVRVPRATFEYPAMSRDMFEKPSETPQVSHKNVKQTTDAAQVSSTTTPKRPSALSQILLLEQKRQQQGQQLERNEQEYTKQEIGAYKQSTQPLSISSSHDVPKPSAITKSIPDITTGSSTTENTANSTGINPRLEQESNTRIFSL